MSNVIQLRPKNSEYKDKIKHMDKNQLLDESILFFEKRNETGLTLKLINEGIILFNELLFHAETDALIKHCKKNLEYLKNIS